MLFHAVWRLIFYPNIISIPLRPEGAGKDIESVCAGYMINYYSSFS